MDLTEQQFNEIIKKIKTHVELPNKHSCRVGWAVVQVAGKKFENSYHNFDKIADAIVESREYIKYRPSGNDKDWNISKNPDFKKETWIEKHPVKYDVFKIIFTAIIAIISSVILSVIITTKTTQTIIREHYQSMEPKNNNAKQTDMVDSTKEINSSNDSLKISSTKEKNDLQNKKP